MIPAGLSVDTFHTFTRAKSLADYALSCVRKTQTSPAAENVAKSAAYGLLAMATLHEAIHTFNIDPDRFLPLAKNAKSFDELYEAVFEYVKDSQKKG